MHGAAQPQASCGLLVMHGAAQPQASGANMLDGRLGAGLA